METNIKQLRNVKQSNFDILPTGYKVNIEFNDLSYQIPDRKQGIQRNLFKKN